MKLRFILSLLATTLFTLQTQAQDYHLGLRTGYIQSQLDFENDGIHNLNSRHAFQIGLVHTYRAHNANLGFSIETGYALKGTRIGADTLDYRLHYLNIPVLFDAYPVNKLRLSIGPEVSYLLDGRNRASDSTSYSLKNVITNRWELAGTVSASYALDYFIDVGVRYTTGLTDLADIDGILNRRRPRNQSLQIFLYFKIAN